MVIRDPSIIDEHKQDTTVGSICGADVKFEVKELPFQWLPKKTYSVNKVDDKRSVIGSAAAVKMLRMEDTSFLLTVTSVNCLGI